MSIFKTLKHPRKSKGQAIIEAVAGLIVFIPIALFLVDILTLILAVSANENLARNAAQAAAKAIDPTTGLGDEDRARRAAINAVLRLACSPIIKQRYLASFSYNGAPRNPDLDSASPTSVVGQVNASTLMIVSPPAPFPFFSEATFVSRSTATIVSREPLTPPIPEAVPTVPIGF